MLEIAKLTQVGTLVSFPQLSCDSKSQSPFNSKSPITIHVFRKNSDDGTVWPFQLSITVDAAIRIDHNPTGVYIFTHALATYRYVHVMHLGNLQAEAQRGSQPRLLTTLIPSPGLSPI